MVHVAMISDKRSLFLLVSLCTCAISGWLFARWDNPGFLNPTVGNPCSRETLGSDEDWISGALVLLTVPMFIRLARFRTKIWEDEAFYFVLASLPSLLMILTASCVSVPFTLFTSFDLHFWLIVISWLISATIYIDGMLHRRKS
jgi:hypothetical protein